MSTYPNYIPTGHPVRTLLRMAAHNDLTSGDLTRMLDGHDEHLPPGQSLSRYRLQLIEAARKVRELGRVGDNARAQTLADDLAADLAGRMTEQERAVTGDPDPEPLADITARMFGR